LMVVVLVVQTPTGPSLGPSVVLLPVILVAQLLFTLGLSLMAASFTVYLRDLEHMVTLGLTALFYLSPVLYPLDPHALPGGAAKFIPILSMNPMAWFLNSYHSVLFYGTWPDATSFALMLAAAVVTLVVGYAVFLHFRPHLPEEV
jgi:lipopolysaccharide transport system permease protein